MSPSLPSSMYRKGQPAIADPRGRIRGRASLNCRADRPAPAMASRSISTAADRPAIATPFARAMGGRPGSWLRSRGGSVAGATFRTAMPLSTRYADASAAALLGLPPRRHAMDRQHGTASLQMSGSSRSSQRRFPAAFITANTVSPTRLRAASGMVADRSTESDREDPESPRARCRLPATRDPRGIGAPDSCDVPVIFATDCPFPFCDRALVEPVPASIRMAASL